MASDILITEGKVLSLASEKLRLLDPGFVRIRDGRIASVGNMADLDDTPPAAERLSARGKLIMPGLVNCHCHAPMTLFRGLADDLPLMTWLMEYIFPAEAGSVDPDMVYWCAKLAAAEMILSGTTCVADGYFYEDQVAEAFLEAGLRGVVAQGVIDFPAPGVPQPEENIRTARRFLAEWRDRHALLTPAVFCHSPYTCSPETLQAAKRVAREAGTLFFLHAAETREEAAQLQERYNTTPIRHLHSLDVLDPATILVHGVWIEEEELDLLAESGAAVVTCPQSNMKLAAGRAPVTEMLDRRIRVGVGTDGAASNNSLDLFRELDCLAKLHKVMRHDPTMTPAREMLRLATTGGAGVLGMEETAGALVPGRAADLIMLDCQRPRLTPLYGPEVLIYAAAGSDVTDVFINGRPVMRHRRLLTIDLAEVLDRVRRLAAKLRTPA